MCYVLGCSRKTVKEFLSFLWIEYFGLRKFSFFSTGSFTRCLEDYGFKEDPSFLVEKECVLSSFKSLRRPVGRRIRPIPRVTLLLGWDAKC